MSNTQKIRKQLSMLLAHTDKQHPMECDYIVGDAYSCGLSDLEKPNIISMYQDGGEIWFQIYGEEYPREFEFMVKTDLDELIKQLKEDNLL